MGPEPNIGSPPSVGYTTHGEVVGVLVKLYNVSVKYNHTFNYYEFFMGEANTLPAAKEYHTFKPIFREVIKSMEELIKQQQQATK
jgi:hypothetical protein